MLNASRIKSSHGNLSEIEQPGEINRLCVQRRPAFAWLRRGKPTSGGPTSDHDPRLKTINLLTFLMLVLSVLLPCAPAAIDNTPVVGPGESIQEAIDAHPGRAIFLSAGEHHIGQPIVFRTSASGIYGPGTIIQ